MACGARTGFGAVNPDRVVDADEALLADGLRVPVRISALGASPLSALPRSGFDINERPARVLHEAAQH